MSNSFKGNLMDLTSGDSGGTDVKDLWAYTKESLNSLYSANSGKSQPTFITAYTTWTNTTTGISYKVLSDNSTSVIKDNVGENFESISSDISISVSNHQQLILCDCSSGAINISAPSLTEDDGFTVTLKKIDATTNNLVINGSSATIDGLASITLQQPNDTIELIYVAGSYKIKSKIITEVSPILEVTASSYDVLSTHHNNIILYANSENSVVNLPSTESLNTGFEITIKKTTSNAFNVTILATGGDTIDGLSSYDIISQYDFITLINVGDKWYIINKGI